MDLEPEHVSLGDDAGRAPVAGAPRVLLGRGDRCPRRAERRHRTQRTPVRDGCLDRKIAIGGIAAYRSQLRAMRAARTPVAISLLNSDCSTVTAARWFVNASGWLSASGGEVCFGEAALRQQRAEHVHRLVAALHALDDIDARQPRALRLPERMPASASAAIAARAAGLAARAFAIAAASVNRSCAAAGVESTASATTRARHSRMLRCSPSPRVERGVHQTMPVV